MNISKKSIFTAVSLTTLLLGSLAFASSTNDNPSDKDGWFDITVLTAKVGSLTLKNFDHVENCNKTEDKYSQDSTGVNHHFEAFDCTAYIGSQLGATAFKPFPLWTFDNGRLTSSFQLDTPIADVYTVTPIDRLALATYVGFSEANQGGLVNLFVANGPDGQTRESGRITLKDGRTGIVHHWIGAFESTGRSSTGILRELPFKPCLVRQVSDSFTRYWDPLIGTGMGNNYDLHNYEYGNHPGRPYMGIIDPNSYDNTSILEN
jgi:hypothetical protein